MLDKDLAELYGYEVKRLNEQEKRNISRFPEDFMFKLYKEEISVQIDGCPLDAQKTKMKYFCDYKAFKA